MQGRGRIDSGRLPILFLIGAVAILASVFGPAAAASADTFTVDSVGDAPKAVVGAECQTAAGECTLRAAIEAADQDPAFDTVAFEAAEFPGGISGTIEPSSALPAITGPMAVDGQCPARQFGEFPYGTCVGLDATGLAHGFLVEADEVTIRGIAITGAAIGIDVANSADEFAARNDVLGANLADESGPNGTGILLGPGVDEAQIGTYAENGTSGNDRFVGNTEVGLDLEGASRALIRNNDFGASPAPNGTDIAISDVMTGGRVVKAVDNEIGAKKSSFGEFENGCSEGCNLISGAASDGIDLAGGGADRLPATGPTLIYGNVIGATSSGEAAAPDEGVGIAVGSAGEVTIGGPHPASEGNEFAGGRWAVTAGPEEHRLAIEGNSVGVTTGEHGDRVEAPSEGAFAVETLNQAAVDTLPLIVGNTIWMSGGIGVLDTDMGGWVAENRIFDADTAIRVDGERMWWGAYVEDNLIESPGEYGVVIDNWNNEVTGNRIFSATKAGILVESAGWTWGTSDVIGGSPGEVIGEDWSEEHWWRYEQEAVENEEAENEISYSGGPAIEVVGEHTAFVDVLRNYGKGNGGQFVDLGGDGPGNQTDGPNKGIQAPTIVSATQNEVSGLGAVPGGPRVMVFLKLTSSPGEIEEFIGAASVEEGGHWSLALPERLPAGTPIAVSQASGEEGSSELAFATLAAAAEIVPAGEVGDGSGSEGRAAEGEEKVSSGSTDLGSPPKTHSSPDPGAQPSPVRPVRSLVPSTHILAAPPESSTHTNARFRFAASVAGAKFECRLDGKKWSSCKAPKTYEKLKPGKHLFEVRATAGGAVGTDAKFRFTVKP